jgi:hypothetical protein
VTSNEQTNVRISWTEPTYDGGSSLTGYRITIQANDGLSYFEERDHCWGEDQTTKANMFCLIPMTVLRAAPYNLPLGQTIVALVEAKNVIGYSLPSDPSISGAEVRTEPLQPDTVVERVEIGTTDTEIKVSYQTITDNTLRGGSPVISLEIWYDQGVDNWIPLFGAAPFHSLDETYTVGPLFPGHYYNFKYRAVNIFGLGAFSEVSTIQAATKPDQIVTPL